VATATDTAPKQTSTLIVALDEESVDALALAVARRVAELIPDPAEDGWLDGYTAANYLGIPYSTFKKLTAAGRLEGCQDTEGGRFYYQRADLDAWRRGESR
jgi:excisionase family DNA binding protein